MKKITFDPIFIKELKKISKKDKKLYQQIVKQLDVFSQNPNHPSLRLHKLKGQLKQVWSLSINRSYRILFVDDYEYYFFSLGTHDQVYQ